MTDIKARFLDYKSIVFQSEIISFIRRFAIIWLLVSAVALISSIIFDSISSLNKLGEILFTSLIISFAISALVAVFRIPAIVMRGRNNNINNQLDERIEKFKNSKDQLLLVELQQKSLYYRKLSLQLLTMVGVLVIIAAFYFGIAGKLFNADTGLINPIQPAENALERSQKNVEYFSRVIEEERRRESELQSELQSGKVPQDIQPELQSGKSSGGDYMKGYTNAILGQEGLTQRYFEMLNEYTPSKIAESQSGSITRILWLNITRFGGTVLILYLIAIILPIQRYCLQLSAYYGSRADALLLAHDDIEILKKNLDFISAESLRVGAAPRNLIEKILDLLKARSSFKKTDL